MKSENIAASAAAIEEFSAKRLAAAALAINEFKVLVEHTLAEAESTDGIRRSEELHTFTKSLAEVIQPLVADPLSELTRKRQEKLMIVGAISLLITQGLVFFEKFSVYGADLKASSSWSAGVATTIACAYFLVTFIAGYVRDLNTTKATQVLPVIHLDLLRKQSFFMYAEKLRDHLHYAESALSAVEKSQSRADELRAIPEGAVTARTAFLHQMVVESRQPNFVQADLDSAKAEVAAASQKIDLAFGIVEKVREIDRLRIIVELCLPTALALLAIVMGVKYIIVSLP
jgi:hypothetical protein